MNDNQFLWNQFCKLGEMMGDGLHYEPDGKWISTEYKKLSRILIPELKEDDKKERLIKATSIDVQMEKLTAEKKCQCGGKLKQARKGSKIAYCQTCNARYKAKSKK